MRPFAPFAGAGGVGRGVAFGQVAVRGPQRQRTAARRMLHQVLHGPHAPVLELGGAAHVPRSSCMCAR